MNNLISPKKRRAYIAHLICFGMLVMLTIAGTAGCNRENRTTGETPTKESYATLEPKEPGMYFLGKFTSWEQLEATSSFRVEDGRLQANVDYECETTDHPDRIGGTIVLPEGITTIDEYIFAGCHHVEKVILPDTVQCIKRCAFRGCGQLQELELPDGVSWIGKGAFSGCKQIKELKVPDSVTRIGRSAFKGVGNVSYHGAVLYTPDDVYWGAKALNQKAKNQGETFEVEAEGVRYTCRKFDEIENAIVITKIENVPRNLVIPAKLDGFDVYCVGDGDTVIAGYNDKKVKMKEWGDNYKVPVIGTITIENGIKGIASRAFERVYSEHLSLPESLEFINYVAFRGNSFLTELVIKSSHVDIGKWAFSECFAMKKCKWETGTFTGNIGEGAFHATGMRELQLPVMEDMKNQMGSMAFERNIHLKKVTFAEGTREVSINQGCFGYCPNAWIIIGKGVETFSSDGNTNSGKVRLLDKKTKIVFSKIVKGKAWYEDVEEPEGEEFRYRTSYREFAVPKGFEQIDMLKKAYYVVDEEDYDEVSEGEKKEFYRSPYFLLKRIKITMHPAVSHAKEWKKTKHDGVEYTYRFSQKEQNSVEIVHISKAPPDLKIPSRLAGHKVYAMVYPEGHTGPYISFRKGKFPKVKAEDGKMMKALHSLTIYEGMEYMNFAPLAKQIILPHSMVLVDEDACRRNKALEKLIIQNPNMEISSNAFTECSNLTQIIWPNAEFKGTVGRDAFSQCGLKTLKLPYMQDMKRQIKLHAFAWNKKLKKITFDKQNSRVKVGDEWFTGCKKARIIVGKNVKSFSSKANTYVKTVRLLGKKTKLTGFSKIIIAEDGPYKGTYVKTDNPVVKNCKYYIQYKKFIVPKGSKALPVLKKAYYGSTDKVDSEELHASEENEYFYSGNPIKKVKVIKKKQKFVIGKDDKNEENTDIIIVRSLVDNCSWVSGQRFKIGERYGRTPEYRGISED